MPRKPAERAPVAMEDDQSVAGGWLRGIRFSGFSFVMMGILVLAVMVLAPSLRTYVEQRQQIDRLAASVDDAKEHVEELTSERERWNDRTYITTQARDRLSYVLPGDISFLVINDLPTTADITESAPVSTDIQDTKVDWLQSVFASVMTAGLAPEAAKP
ncbi:FtsB family cell division protein [Glaciibacter superstes]|uniref:FtsB family cell division protein n=1 Tax=Glaciibacter superstes TaxID=501023 RepID=UPI0003B73D1E|nr:septum formation initiator family protein [Glaciibacter superstes]